MGTKRLLILASSIKKHGRCVAGREIVEQQGRTTIGAWIRPIGPAEEGTLYAPEFHLHVGRPATVLDVVDIDFTGHTPGAGQPENWLIAPGRDWRHVHSIPIDNGVLTSLREDVPDLWWGGDRSNRISMTAQSQRQPLRSLVLVAPRRFHVRWGWEYNHWEGYWRRRWIAEFEHGRQSYSLNITDPVFTNHECNPFPAKPDKPDEEGDWCSATPRCGDDCLLCISLTPPLNGYHYKVVATVLSAM